MEENDFLFLDLSLVINKNDLGGSTKFGIKNPKENYMFYHKKSNFE